MTKLVLFLKENQIARVLVLLALIIVIGIPFLPTEMKDFLILNALKHIAPLFVIPLFLAGVYAWLFWKWRQFSVVYSIIFVFVLALKLIDGFAAGWLQDQAYCTQGRTGLAFENCMDAALQRRR